MNINFYSIQTDQYKNWRSRFICCSSLALQKGSAVATLSLKNMQQAANTVTRRISKLSSDNNLYHMTQHL